MQSNLNLILSLLTSVALLSVTCEATAQWQKIPTPSDEPDFLNKYSELYFTVLSKDTIYGFTKDKQTKEQYFFRTFDQGKTWKRTLVPFYPTNEPTIQRTENNMFIFSTLIGRDSVYGIDTISNVYSKDFCDTWQTKTFHIKQTKYTYTPSYQPRFIDENTFYTGGNKHDISGNVPKSTTLFNSPRESNSNSIRLENFHIKYWIPRSGTILITVVEQYQAYPDKYDIDGLFFVYSLVTEDDGISWYGISGLNESKKYTPFARFYYDDVHGWTHYFDSPENNSWWEVGGVLYSSRYWDTVGTVIMYADKPFPVRPKRPFNPDFVKEQSGIKNFAQVYFDLVFVDSNRAYCTGCEKTTSDPTSKLKVYDRFKGLTTMSTPGNESRVLYADNDLLIIHVLHRINDSIYTRNLYKLKTSDIVGINDDDQKQAALVVIYPNPAENILRWNIDDGTAEITDMQGRSMQQLPASARQADVSGLAAGVYVLTVRTAAGAVSRTFVKE